MKMTYQMKLLLNIAEAIGEIEEVYMGDWVGKYERINITGKTPDGKNFTMTLEIDKEVEQDAEELE